MPEALKWTVTRWTKVVLGKQNNINKIIHSRANPSKVGDAKLRI